MPSSTTCGMMLVTQQKLNFYFSVFWSYGFGKSPRVIRLNQAYILVPWLNASFSCITFVVSQFLAKIEKKSSKTWREIWDFFFDNPGSIFVQWMGLDICLTDTITNYYTCGGNSMYYVYRRITFQTFFGFSPRRMHSLVFYRYVNKSCFLIYDLIWLFYLTVIFCTLIPVFPFKYSCFENN